jgi:hypothetical protein
MQYLKLLLGRVQLSGLKLKISQKNDVVRVHMPVLSIIRLYYMVYSCIWIQVRSSVEVSGNIFSMESSFCGDDILSMAVTGLGTLT